jgi:hypothetical protein
VVPEETAFTVPITTPDEIVTVGLATVVGATGIQSTCARSAAADKRRKLYCILSRNGNPRETICQGDVNNRTYGDGMKGLKVGGQHKALVVIYSPIHL